MFNFMVWLLKKREEPFEIAFLNAFHILYFAIAIGAAIALAYYLKAHPEKKTAALRILAYSLVISYVADFFVQPFISMEATTSPNFNYGDFEMNIDKLPFHICTVLCPIVAFTQFNAKFDKFKEPVAFLAIAAPLMYMVYPGNAIGEISPFCYKIIQTFVYHGILFSWGLNTLASGQFVPKLKNCYKSLIGICIIAAWATLGNLAYNTSYAGGDGNHHYDWFFLTGSSFSMPPYIMPFAVIAIFFSVVLCIYGLYYAYVSIMAKREAKKVVKETVTVD